LTDNVPAAVQNLFETVSDRYLLPKYQQLLKKPRGLDQVSSVARLEVQSYQEHLSAGGTTARVLASQAEAIVRTGKTWPQATKRRKATKRRN